MWPRHKTLDNTLSSVKIVLTFQSFLILNDSQKTACVMDNHRVVHQLKIKIINVLKLWFLMIYVKLSAFIMPVTNNTTFHTCSTTYHFIYNVNTNLFWK